MGVLFQSLHGVDWKPRRGCGDVDAGRGMGRVLEGKMEVESQWRKVGYPVHVLRRVEGDG